METRGTRMGLGVWAVLVLLFLYIPIAIIVLYAFNGSNVQSWPIAGLTTKWCSAPHESATATSVLFSSSTWP